MTVWSFVSWSLVVFKELEKSEKKNSEQCSVRFASKDIKTVNFE